MFAVRDDDLTARAIESAVSTAAAPLHEEPRLAMAVHHHRLGHFAEAESYYLWARMANAMNPPGVANWQTSYALLLRHVAQMRGAAPVKP